MWRISISCLVLFILFATGCSGWAYKVPTGSMLPTIKVRSTVLVNPFEYSFNEIERFDIIVFKAPIETVEKSGLKESVKYVMRVVGLPGEKLEIKNNRLFINNKLVDEDFEKIISENDTKKNFSAIVIPENEFFILGDNRPNSEDSRYWKHATINRETIGGKIIEIMEPDN